jgi:NADH:ubiquinone oxidoreductase subunit 6 (subunit J)
MLILYYLLFSITIGFSLIIILSNNCVHAVLSLIGCVTTIALILFTLEFEFISYLLLLVYVGAVLILFLFVTKMININYIYNMKKNLFDQCVYYPIFIKWFILSHWFVITYPVGLNVNSNIWVSNFIHFKIHDIILFSNTLYTQFFFYTLLIAIILLVSMLGSIALCLSKNT